MYSGKYADRVIAGSKDTGFCNMTPFFVDIFSGCAFRAVPDNAKCLKFVTIRLYHIAVINVEDRFRRNPLLYGLKICRGSLRRDSRTEVSGKAVHRVDLFGILMELVCNICQKAASGSEYAVSDVCCKFLLGFCQAIRNFI